MDMVEILLFWLVGFSVMVSLVLDNLDSLEKRRKTFDEALQKGDDISFCEAKEDGKQEEEKSEEEAEKQLVVENFKGEETENIVNASDEKSDYFCSTSGNNDGEIIVDDWEGIERSQLDKIFGEAMVFVSCISNADQIEDVKFQLYGLQKIALEGPCHGSQPMPFKVSARSKWSAWQKLGDMSREMAMEKYIDILTEAIPDWKDYAGRSSNFRDITTTRQDNKLGVDAER